MESTTSTTIKKIQASLPAIFPTLAGISAPDADAPSKVFKDDLREDIEDGAVWFYDGDFADWHTVNGLRVLCEIGAINNEMREIGRLIGGVVRDASYLIIRSRDFKTRPIAGQPIDIDGTRYRIAHVMDDLGAYVIEFGRYDDADVFGSGSRR